MTEAKQMEDRQAYSKVEGNTSALSEGVMEMKQAVWANSRHLGAIGAVDAWEMTEGEGVRIAILDSGVDSDHPDLQGALEGVYDMTGGNGEDSTGHGTHCVGLVSAQKNTDGVTGVAPRAKVISIKVMGKDNHGTVHMLRDGLRKAIDLDVDIINLSLGTKTHPGPEVELLLDEAEEKGILVVAASGNENGPVLFPARFDNVVAVSGIDEAGMKADFSNYGIENVICAPAVGLVSTFTNGRYAKMSGTSMAAPVIAGVFALGISILKKKNKGKMYTRKKILGLMPHVTSDLGMPGKDDYFGWGIIDSTKFCRILSNESEETF